MSKRAFQAISHNLTLKNETNWYFWGISLQYPHCIEFVQKILHCSISKDWGHLAKPGKFGNCQLLKQRSKYNITERTHCVILFKNLPKKNHNHRPPFVVQSLTSSVNYCHNFQVQKLYLAPTLATYSKRMFDSVQILAEKLQATKGLCVALSMGGFDFW